MVFLFIINSICNNNKISIVILIYSGLVFISNLFVYCFSDENKIVGFIINEDVYSSTNNYEKNYIFNKKISYF
jgi:hypothetical protein